MVRDSGKKRTGEELKQISVYLHPDELISLDELVLEKRKANREVAVRRNDLIREAIQEFIQREQQAKQSH
jgi:metal-responsive CopG/Arc/MetJ family transcriptional regulator